MAYLKGLLPKDKVPVFLDFLGRYGYAIRPSAAKYELGQVLILARWSSITVDAKGVVGLPEELSGYVKEFLKSVFNIGITDTQRLDFILEKCRKVVIEQVGYNGRGDTYFEVYVEEGFMSDRKYPPVRIVGKSTDVITSDVKRQAIDLAINDPVSVSEKV